MEEGIIEPPRSFPAPVVGRGAMRKGNVMVEPGRVSERHLLVSVSPTGDVVNTYEIGRSLRDCIYGQVRHCILLRPSQYPQVLERTSENVAIKIYQKVKLLFLKTRTYGIMNLIFCSRK